MMSSGAAVAAMVFVPAGVSVESAGGLAGFVHACALVRPEGLATLEPRSVRKKLKQKSFASGVHREDVIAGAQELGVELDDHTPVVIEALLRPAGARGTRGLA